MSLLLVVLTRFFDYENWLRLWLDWVVYSVTWNHVHVVGHQLGVAGDVSEEHPGVGAPGEAPHQHQGGRGQH